MTEENYDIEVKAEKLRDEAMADLDAINIESAINKFVEAANISGQGIPLENLEVMAKKSLDEYKIDDFIMQLGLAGQDPVGYIKTNYENPIKYLTDCKNYAWEKRFKCAAKNGNGILWEKRHNLAVQLLKNWR